jgi:hypothetical protein
MRFLLPNGNANEIPLNISLFSGGLVRYRTAALLSIVLVGGMFAVPAAIEGVFLPSLKQGIPNPVPGYEQILLRFGLFFLTWRFLLAIPILVVLFTVAAFTSTGLHQEQRGSIRGVGDQPMIRPVGITAIATVSILGGIALAVLEMLSQRRPEGGLAWILIVVIALSVGLGIALLRLQNWARAVVIVLYGLSLLPVAGHVILGHGAANVLIELARGFYLLWAVWYLHQPHVKTAFARA